MGTSTPRRAGWRVPGSLAAPPRCLPELGPHGRPFPSSAPRDAVGRSGFGVSGGECGPGARRQGLAAPATTGRRCLVLPREPGSLRPSPSRCLRSAWAAPPPGPAQQPGSQRPGAAGIGALLDNRCDSASPPRPGSSRTLGVQVWDAEGSVCRVVDVPLCVLPVSGLSFAAGVMSSRELLRLLRRRLL